MNTTEKVVQVGEVQSRGLEIWLLQGTLVLIGSALLGWAWWLFG
jgi:hypothetical protein